MIFKAEPVPEPGVAAGWTKLPDLDTEGDHLDRIDAKAA